MFAFLFAFLGDATPMHRYSWMPVDLPASSQATPQDGASREDAMRITIDRDGRVFFGDMRVSQEDVPELVRNAVSQGSEKKVYLAVDSRSRFADTALAMEEISKAGIREICFLTQKAQR